MRDTTVTILRGGNNNPANVLLGTDNRPATGILVQVDQMDMKEMARYHPIYEFIGMIGYKVYTVGWPINSLIKQDDILVDERFTDPDTGALYRYHVVGRPKDYPFDHQQLLCDVPVGT